MAASDFGDDVQRVRDDAERLARDTRRGVRNGRDAAPEFVQVAKERARELFGDQVDRWRGQGREAADVAGEGLENARVYVVERVQERPLTATLAALGVGFLLGAVLAGSRR